MGKMSADGGHLDELLAALYDILGSLAGNHVGRWRVVGEAL